MVAVMIPVTTQIAKNSGRASSKLLIPVSYASIFGGTCTLIGTSTNILVNGIAVQNGYRTIWNVRFHANWSLLCFGGIFIHDFHRPTLTSNQARK